MFELGRFQDYKTVELQRAMSLSHRLLLSEGSLCEAEGQTVRRLLEGCRGLQEAGWADVSCENWFSSLLIPTVHSRRCLSSLSVLEKFCSQAKKDGWEGKLEEQC